MTEHLPDERLQDLLDDRLPHADRAATEEHLQRCPACADRWAVLVGLRDRASLAPRAIAPPGDWWPEVRAAIEARKVVPLGGVGRGAQRPWWTRPLPAIAAVAALVVVTATVATWIARRETPPESTLAVQMVAELAGYETTARSLLQEFEVRRGRLPPGAQADVARNLMVVDSAIREIQTILQVDPTNETLLGVLVASYRQKVAMLEHVNQAAS